MRRAAIAVLLLILGVGQSAAERVERVIDGDTIKLADGRRVRYIGMDTPELARDGCREQPGAREASAINRRIVGGREVRLEYDVERFDRYGRTLAYVWVGRTMANAELLRRGYAVVLPPVLNRKYAERFERLEREAREARRGLWHGAPVGATRRLGVPLLCAAGACALLLALYIRFTQQRDPGPDNLARVDRDVRRAERKAQEPMKRPPNT